ncbi:MAG: P-II family nitrogen regulator [Thiogranum sp.]|nr:P-II family nitrogen regulator [Thiogranum sp.]
MMHYSKVTAIVRVEKLEAVEDAITAAGATGMTVTEVHGRGELKNFFKRDRMVTHARVEIFTTGEQTQTLVGKIMAVASTGEAGDGIVAVLPVGAVYRIRDRRAAFDHELSE